MTKLVRSLTATNGKAYGIERAEQYDFKDDGSSFKGYIYKGMPLTQCVSKYGTFLSIRVDYLENNFTFKDWMATDEHKLEDEFNGCEQVDLDKLVDNLEKIIEKRNELNDEVCVDLVELDKKIAEEAAKLKVLKDRLAYVLSSNTKKQWYELEGYTLKKAGDYAKSASANIKRKEERLEKIKLGSIRDKRYFLEVGLSCGDFYVRELEEIFGVN